MRSRSLATTRRVATDCTRPADSRGMTFFHSTGETSYPYRRSSTRRVWYASTRPRSRSRGCATASAIACGVISWKTMRRVGHPGLELLQQVPGDRLALAVLVSGEQEFVGAG